MRNGRADGVAQPHAGEKLHVVGFDLLPAAAAVAPLPAAKFLVDERRIDGARRAGMPSTSAMRPGPCDSPAVR